MYSYNNYDDDKAEREKREWEMKYQDRVLYFSIVRNPSNHDKLSVVYTAVKDYDYYNQTKYVLVKKFNGIKYNKYESFKNKYWELYNAYCSEENFKIQLRLLKK